MGHASLAIEGIQFGLVLREDDAAAHLQTDRQLIGSHRERPRQHDELLHLLVGGNVSEAAGDSLAKELDGPRDARQFLLRFVGQSDPICLRRLFQSGTTRAVSNCASSP